MLMFLLVSRFVAASSFCQHILRAGIAQVSAQAGLNVTLIDLNGAVLADSKQRIASSVARVAKKQFAGQVLRSSASGALTPRTTGRRGHQVVGRGDGSHQHVGERGGGRAPSRLGCRSHRREHQRCALRLSCNTNVHVGCVLVAKWELFAQLDKFAPESAVIFLFCFVFCFLPLLNASGRRRFWRPTRRRSASARLPTPPATRRASVACTFSIRCRS